MTVFLAQNPLATFALLLDLPVFVSTMLGLLFALALIATFVGFRGGLLDQRMLNSVLAMMVATATLGLWLTGVAIQPGFAAGRQRRGHRHCPLGP